MPNWKKLITSGSSGSLAYLSVDTSIDALSFTGSILSTNGIISSSGNLVSGELVYGTGGSSVSSSNLLYLDTANKRIGVKTTSPQYPFHYIQDTGNALAVYEKQGGAAVFYEAQDTRAALGTVGSHPLLFAINSGEVARINTSGVYEGKISGSITGSILATNGVLSSSAQIASDISGSITSTSSSIASDIATLVAFSSSLETTIYDYTGSFTGDGSGLTNVTTTITEESTVSQTFTSANTASVSHLFGTKDVIVTVYDNNDDQFIPSRVNTPDTNTAVVYMDPATTGRVVVAKGGHLVSGSIHKTLITGTTSSIITHNLQEEFPIVQLYESASKEVFIPQTIKSIDEDNTQVVLSELVDCYVVIKR